jgi:predicted DNA-binding transcriptional regulator AlpA
VKLPSLNEIAGGADLAGLNRRELATLLATCGALQVRIVAALIAIESTPAPVTEDRLLNATEAAARLSVAPAWLYKRARQLPFAVKLGGHVRFSELRLTRYLANRTGTTAEVRPTRSDA